MEKMNLTQCSWGLEKINEKGRSQTLILQEPFSFRSAPIQFAALLNKLASIPLKPELHFYANANYSIHSL
jgi:hypothetical protein